MNELKNLHKKLSNLEDQLEQMIVSAIVIRAKDRGAPYYVTHFINERKKISKVSEFIASAGELADAKDTIAAFEAENRTLLKKLWVKLLAPFALCSSTDNSISAPLPMFERHLPDTLQKELLDIVLNNSICKGLKKCLKLVQSRATANKFFTNLMISLDVASRSFVEHTCLHDVISRLREEPCILEKIGRTKKECRRLRDRITDAIGADFTVIPSDLDNVTLEDFVGISRLRDHLDLIPDKQQKESLLSEIMCVKERIDSLEDFKQPKQQPS